MPIYLTCACGAKLQIPDDAGGKAVACPKCKMVLKAPASAEVPLVGLLVETPIPVPQPPPVTNVEQAVVPPPTRRWYYTRNGRPVGPLTESEVYQAIGRGEIRYQDDVWHKGLRDWQPASSHFTFAPPSIASPPPAVKDRPPDDKESPPLKEDGKAPRQKRRRASPNSDARIQYYSAPHLDMSDLERRLERWLERESFNTQVLDTEDGGTLIQIEKQGSWRTLVGMSTVLNIVLRKEGEELSVEIGAGKWVDKATVGIVSLFVLRPLAVTAAFGAWEQMKMPERIFDYISDYVRREKEPSRA